MKKSIVKKMIIIGVVAAMVLAGCSQGNAQSANKEKKIIGSWVTIPLQNTEPSTTVIFNADGTVNWDGRTTEWYATDTKIAMAVGKLRRGDSFEGFRVGNNDFDDRTGIFDYSVSTDGKTLIFSNGYNFVLTKE